MQNLRISRNSLCRRVPKYWRDEILEPPDCRESFQPQLYAMNRHEALLRNSRLGVQNSTDTPFSPVHNENGETS